MIEKRIIISNKEITYIVKKRVRQRQVNFIVHQDGLLVVTSPKLCPQKLIEKEIKKKSTVDY